MLKQYIQSSQGDLLTTWRSIEQAIANQIQTIKAKAAQDRIRTPLALDRRQYHACFGYITTTALRLVQDHYDLSERPFKPCTGVFNTTTGLPCAHMVEDIRERQISLLPEHFHKHWYTDRYTDIPMPILEPLHNISTSRSYSTRRIPSGFEALETQVRRCGLCRLPGHTRGSIRCMVNIRQAQEEFRPLAVNQSGLNPALFIPRAAVQAIFDSATHESALKTTLKSILQSSGDQLILKSTIQSILNSTTKLGPELSTELSPEPAIELGPELSPELSPEPAPDTRPIWPGRIEVIYKHYIAEKEAWLASHPTVRPINYRKARGLRAYSRQWIKDNKWRLPLPLQRLNLDTETLLDQEDGPQWTDEEIRAWHDYKELVEQRVEEEEEAAFIRRGGFSGERGIGSLWRQIDANIEADKARYRFFN